MSAVQAFVMHSIGLVAITDALEAVCRRESQACARLQCAAVERLGVHPRQVLHSSTAIGGPRSCWETQGSRWLWRVSTNILDQAASQYEIGSRLTLSVLCVCRPCQTGSGLSRAHLISVDCLQIIDLDVLDKIGSVKGAADLKAQLKKQVSSCQCVAGATGCLSAVPAVKASVHLTLLR